MSDAKTSNSITTQQALSLTGALLITIGGYYVRSIASELREVQASQVANSQVLVEMATLQKQQPGIFERITKTLDDIDARVSDNDRRLTRREDNQFTSQDGSKLQASVTENSTLTSKHSEALNQLRVDDRKMREQIMALYRLSPQRSAKARE